MLRIALMLVVGLYGCHSGEVGTYTWRHSQGILEFKDGTLSFNLAGVDHQVPVTKIRDGQFEGERFRFFIDEQGLLHLMEGRIKHLVAEPLPETPRLKSSKIARSLLGPAAYFESTKEAVAHAQRAETLFERFARPGILGRWYDIHNQQTYSLVAESDGQHSMVIHGQALSPLREEPLEHNSGADEYQGQSYHYQLHRGDLIQTHHKTGQKQRLFRRENLKWFEESPQ